MAALTVPNAYEQADLKPFGQHGVERDLTEDLVPFVSYPKNLLLTLPLEYFKVSACLSALMLTRYL